MTKRTDSAEKSELKLVSDQGDEGIRASGTAAAVPLVSAVIPVYNEEGIIRSSVVALREGLIDLGWTFEIILAENGSSDRTVELCRELATRYPEVTYFSIGEPNYGAALKEGILRAIGTYVVCDEIDLGDLDFYRRSVSGLKADNAAMIVGSKRLAGADDTRPLYRRVATLTYNTMLRVLFHFHGTDTHGMKAFRRDVLIGTAGRCLVDKDVFASEFVIRAEQERHPVVEIPVRVVEKRAPSIALFRRVPNVIKNLARLAYVLRIMD